MEEDLTTIIDAFENIEIHFQVPSYVYEDLNELSYEYYSRLQWIGENYPNPCIITEYSKFLENIICNQIENFLYIHGKSILKTKILNIQYSEYLEEDIIDQMLDEYIEKFR